MGLASGCRDRHSRSRRPRTGAAAPLRLGVLVAGNAAAPARALRLDLDVARRDYPAARSDICRARRCVRTAPSPVPFAAARDRHALHAALLAAPRAMEVGPGP